MISTIRKYWYSRKIRYLLAGGWNTLFGYSTGVALYYSLSNYLHLIEIALLANAIAITMAFLSYKLFVFQTQGNWLREYFRSYLVYGVMALFGIALLWIMVDGFDTPFWLAQAIVVVATVIISYISHSRFTFKANR